MFVRLYYAEPTIIPGNLFMRHFLSSLVLLSLVGCTNSKSSTPDPPPLAMEQKPGETGKPYLPPSDQTRAQGIVKLNNVPLAGVLVQFHGERSPAPVETVIDGSFRVDALEAGSYKVTVEPKEESAELRKEKVNPPKPIVEIPGQLQRVTTTPLLFEVKKGPNVINISLVTN